MVRKHVAMPDDHFLSSFAVLNTTAFFLHAIPSFTIIECQHVIKMIAENKLHAAPHSLLLK